MADLHVRVPASTSNLGPGFDTLGMAVDLFLEAHFWFSPKPLRLERRGTLRPAGAPGGPARAELAGLESSDLVLHALLETTRDIHMPCSRMAPLTEPGDPTGLLRLDSTIPVGCGLGSSAAARVAGRILGLLLRGAPVIREDVLNWAAAREGHPDNAAPAVLGGLVVASLLPAGGVAAVPLPVSSRIGWAYAAPRQPLDTAAARAALPATVPLAAAARNAGRLALLLPALQAGDGPLLAHAMDDELHVPWRLPLIAGAAAARAAGLTAGAWAVTLSGAGSGLIAATPPARAAGVARAMADAFRAATGEADAVQHVLRVQPLGAEWGPGAAPDDPGGRRLAGG
ncbi:MAG: hypothetical protein RQ751_10125 [Longimicrobiales bacterium]|nr:hypothetical protein [Longimicrobiales bacterium]